MNNMCPECHVELVLWDDKDIEVDQYGTTVTEVTLFCGICGYENVVYED